jgi:hypothetical protein
LSPLLIPNLFTSYSDLDIDKMIETCDKSRTIREQLHDQIIRAAENFIRPRIMFTGPDANHIIRYTIYETVIINENYSSNR